MTHGMTKLTGLVLAAGLGLGLLATTGSDAQAHSRGFSFYGGPGGFSFSIGPRYGYGYYPYRHYYSPYYYYAPPRRYYRKKRYGRCHYKARKCARNWGWYNHNWRGCMRYYHCR